jgi:ABC-type transport system involved in cytochrome c biogenesis permease subunit
VERTEVILFWFAFLAYATAFVFFAYYLVTRRAGQNRLALALAGLGFALQTVAIGLRVARAGHAPVVGAYESLLTISWCVMLVYLVLEWRTQVKALGLFVMPAQVVLLLVAWTQYEAPAVLRPALKSDIVVIHVVVIFTAVAAFVVAGGAAAIYLVEERLLKAHRATRVLGRLPSLQTLDRLTTHAVMFGFPFLTMGIVAGVVRAQKFGVAGWYGDPLVLLAFGAWLVYVACLAARHYGGWRGRRTAWFALAGLACLLLIRFLAIPYLSDFHTWGA